MRYLILGPLEVRDVPLAQGRQRLLLAVLLLHRNEVVASERLIDQLWGETPPATAGASLHNLVSALRKALGAGALVTHGHGYALTVAPGEVDADAFDTLAASGRAALADGDAGRATTLLGEALALWRGPALGDLAYELTTAAERLEDQRLSAVEDRIDADLALGRHVELVTVLAELVEGHPQRERLRAQQMLALYRSDRQAEALAAYQDHRRRLASELGILPAPALRALEQSILEHDPALAGPRRARRRPRRRRWPAATASAAVLLGAAAFVLAREDSPGSAAHTSPVRVDGDAIAVIDPATHRVSASYPVGATPMSVSVGGGAAWAVSADAQTIARIDLRDHTTRTFGTGSVPLELAAASDAVWLVAADPDDARGPVGGAPGQLRRLDVNSGSVAQDIELEPSDGPAFRLPPGLIAVDREAVWAMGRDGRLLRLDRASGATRVLPGRRRVAFVAAGGGQVWAVRATENEHQPNLVRLDPGSGRVLERVLVPWASITGLAVGAGAVWVTDPYAGVVWRIDPGPAPLQRTIPLDFGVDSVAADGHSVWAANSVTGTVSHLDPATNRVLATVPLGGTPRAVTLGAGRVWVAVAGGERRAAGSPAGGAIRALSTAGCGPLLTAAGAQPQLLIAADLPTQGRFASTDLPVAAAIAHVLRAHGFRAGRFPLALQSCDDSIAQSGGPDDTKCRANARAYAENPAVIGVVGPVHSVCAEAMLPILNRAPSGPVSVVSPTNTRVSLTRSAIGVPAGHLRRLYPTGQRGYAHVMPADDGVMAATAVAAKQSGARSVFYLYDEPGKPWRVYFRAAARRLHLRMTGEAPWDPEAASYRALARRVRDSGAEAVILDGSVYFRVGHVLRALRRELGADFPILGTESTLPITQLFDEAGSAARGFRVVVPGLQPDGLDATGRAFVRSFGATQPGGYVSQWAVHAAAATEVLLDAIARSDGTRESVAAALATTRLAAGPIGPLTLDRRGEPAVTHATVVRAERGGAPAYVDGIEGGVVERVITLACVTEPRRSRLCG